MLSLPLSLTEIMGKKGNNVKSTAYSPVQYILLPCHGS